MDKRTESQNFLQVIITDGIDSYISEKGKQGYRFSYLHVFIAAYVRLFAERPNLNRFIETVKYMKEIILVFHGYAFIKMMQKRQL